MLSAFQKWSTFTPKQCGYNNHAWVRGLKKKKKRILPKHRDTAAVLRHPGRAAQDCRVTGTRMTAPPVQGHLPVHPEGWPGMLGLPL